MSAELHAAMAQFERCIVARDREVADRVLDDDYALELVHPARATMPRARWLEVLPDYVVHELVAEVAIVDLAGDVATVLHRDRMSATVLGEDRSGIFVITDVWVRRADGWKIWRRHSTPLSAGTLPGS